VGAKHPVANAEWAAARLGTLFFFQESHTRTIARKSWRPRDRLSEILCSVQGSEWLAGIIFPNGNVLL
jgi:hypothetical protein